MFKEVIKDKRVYITTIVLTIAGFIPFFVAMGLALTNDVNVGTFSTYPYVIAGMIAIYVLIGFAWADGYQARHRHKTKNYDGELSDQIKIKLWKIRAPFFIAAAILLVLVIGLGIGFWATGSYVFA